MKFVIALVLASTTACAHGAASGTTAPEAENATASNDETELVCREERVVGSMISNKVCRPKSDGAGNELDAMTRRGAQNVGQGG
jgi:hypothetical protein